MKHLLDYLIAFAVPLAIAGVGLLIVRSFDDPDYQDPFNRTLDDIRSLPEIHQPYDWELEDAA